MAEIIVHMLEKPILHEPVLIEGLPGIGFVANIAALHLINELKATKFCEIHAPTFGGSSRSSCRLSEVKGNAWILSACRNPGYLSRCYCS